MKRLAAVAALVLAACGVPNRKLPPLERTVRAVPPSFPQSTVVDRKVSGVTMRIYNTGHVRTKGAAVSSLKSWSSKVSLDEPFFAIRHPDQGVVLFDLGLTPESVKPLNAGLVTGLLAKFIALPAGDAATQLKKDGLDPAEVRWIIVSHLHLDHTGDLAAFPKATVIVSRREWEDARRETRPSEDSKFLDAKVWEPRLRLRLIDLDGEAPYGAFDHGLDLFADGSLYLVSLPGHTPGSMGLWANLDGGPVLLAGDAAWVVDNYMDLALPIGRAMADPRAYRRSLETIRAMQAAMPRLVVFPGHDLTPRKLSDRDDLPLITPGK
ncbi:MAG: MBL fold metallo-hydrolase [Elusimicrobia bacterium]|nr:MBL fold metallo-hydrolase [Elusimicrobiota bacterium]